MIVRDLLVISSDNLWRLKLRTTLTVAGIVIATTRPPRWTASLRAIRKLPNRSLAAELS